jgi:hypothetical protein
MFSGLPLSLLQIPSLEHRCAFLPPLVLPPWGDPFGMLVLVRSDGHSRALMLAKDILKQTGSYEHTSYAIQDTPTTVV